MGNSSLFFFKQTSSAQTYTLSLHDALPISSSVGVPRLVSGIRSSGRWPATRRRPPAASNRGDSSNRSEEHTSELQSRGHLVCRLLLEKKKEVSQPLAYIRIRGL